MEFRLSLPKLLSSKLVSFSLGPQPKPSPQTWLGVCAYVLVCVGVCVFAGFSSLLGLDCIKCVVQFGPGTVCVFVCLYKEDLCDIVCQSLITEDFFFIFSVRKRQLS